MPFEKVWKHVTRGRTYLNALVKMDTKDLLLLSTVLIQMVACNDATPPQEDMDKFLDLVGKAVDPSLSHGVLLVIPVTQCMKFSSSKGMYTACRDTTYSLTGRTNTQSLSSCRASTMRSQRPWRRVGAS